MIRCTWSSWRRGRRGARSPPSRSRTPWGSPASWSASSSASRCGVLCLGSGSGLARLPGRLCAYALLLCPQLRRQRGTEIVRLEDLANLDLGAAVEGRPLEPLDRFVLGLHLPQPEAGNELLRLGERPVDHSALVAGEPHTRAFRARLQPFAGEHHAGLDQLFVELAHLGEDLLVRQNSRLGVLVGFHDVIE